MTVPAIEDKVRGCLLGGALGDAFGAPYEGQVGPISLGELPSASVTDDTQLTLATCEGIIDAGAVDLTAIAARYVAWFRSRRLRGLGSSTLKALRDLDAGAHWALSGARGEHAAGGGAAMRVAPLAFLLNPSLEDDRVVIRDFCRVTHHSDEAYAAALAVIAAVRAAAAGTWALRSGLIRARTRARAGDPRFIGAFSSASQEHFHYCDGKPV